MLVSDVQQRDSVTYICVFFLFFSIIVYYKILNIVPCVVEEILVVYLFRIW